jgi:hypothetical protein
MSSTHGKIDSKVLEKRGKAFAGTQVNGFI